LKTEIVEETETNIKLAISCTDTGIGIKDEDKKRLFQPFTQLRYDAVPESNSKLYSHLIDREDDVTVQVNETIGESHHQYKGWGLGLHICSRLAKLMNGSIHVNSEYGHGSKFTLTVNLAKIGTHTHHDNAIIHLVPESSPSQTNHELNNEENECGVACTECSIQHNLYPSKYRTVIIAYKNEVFTKILRYYLEKLQVEDIKMVSTVDDLKQALEEYKQEDQSTSNSNDEAEKREKSSIAILCDATDSSFTEVCEKYVDNPSFKIALFVTNKQYETWNRNNYAWVTQPKQTKSPNATQTPQSPPTPDQFAIAKQTPQEGLINNPNVILIKKPIKLRRLMTTLSGRKTSFLTTLMWNMDMNNTILQSLEGLQPEGTVQSPQQESQEQQKTEEKEVERATCHLLLVEDNPINQKLVCRLLNNIGYSKVDLADNGSEALKKIEERNGEPYDLILMDLQMPVMNGFDATIAIRNRNDSHKDTPIVALTANAFSEATQKCHDVGMNNVLT
jgi:CheY-like chemotaxis protein